MEIFDAHADTVSELYDQKKSLAENDLHIDAERLFRYGAYTQVFAIFISPEYAGNAMERAKTLAECFYNETASSGITVCTEYADFKKAKHRAILSLEGGEPIEELSDLDELYKMGIRMIAPTWNFKNKIAGGALEPVDPGLSAFGKSVISKMDKLGIICDTSHLGRKSFIDVAKIFNRPLVASHSDAFCVKNNRRNLTDEEFSLIVKSGGCCGINFYPPFLGDNIRDAILHIDHFLSLGGENCIGIGSDFDGVDKLPHGMHGCEDMEAFIKMLPYDTKIRRKIAFENFERVFKTYNC